MGNEKRRGKKGGEAYDVGLSVLTGGRGCVVWCVLCGYYYY